ncbi:PIN domain-containing protein [Streptomyces ficellus]|uniref:PIN domain-containing protein n=1 Tax=Streptomyces ficellus TaxID=1977088 RepID=A0ABT7ZDL2_9ACTN|nr:PIN domain-containing protein [Streptomyces ficellus]MDN3297604.1 PIN domain-containing protein [Streptomyces ficellus]
MLVTPIPGAHRDNVLKTLRSVHTAAGNIDGGQFGGAYGRLLKYLEWANESVRLLTSQISARDIDRLVRTRTHQTLLDGVGHLAGSDQQRLVNGIVSLEIEQRVAALGEAVDAFQDQMAMWPSGLSLIAPDTSFYIRHPTKFEDVDFAEFAEGTGQVRVLFPMVVVDELDRLKESKDRHTRWRAGHTLAVLDRLLDEDSASALYGVEVLLDSPGHSRLPNPDDEIVDRVLGAKAIAAGPVRLLTYDTGQAMRAKAEGLPVLKLRTGAGAGEEPNS